MVNIIWDNISDKEANELEAVQLSAARVITGGKKGTNHQALYDDLQWKTLKLRRDNHKLVMLFKIKNNLAPHPDRNATTSNSRETRA